jgi:hypothetical protein
MPKVLLHNLSIPYRSYNPEIFHFDQNAVFFAEPGDLMITRKPISSSYFSFLASIGVARPRVHIVTPESAPSSPFGIFEDESIVSAARKHIGNNSGTWEFDCFRFTTWEEKWSLDLGLQVKEGLGLQVEQEGKSYFRSLAKKLGLAVAPGKEYCLGCIDGFTAVLRLGLQGHREVIVKQDEGGAGLGSRRFNLQDILASPFRFKKFFPDQEGWGMVPRHSFAFCVEAWIEDVELSPSIQFYVSEKEVLALSIHQQLFEDNQITYRGCRSWQWIPEKLRELLSSGGRLFAKALQKNRFRGHFSLNAIVRKNGELLWTEANLRRVLSSYPFQIAQRVLDKKSDDIYYVASRVKHASLKGLTIEQLLAKLEPLLFTKEKQRGLIPYEYGLLKEQGKLFILAVGHQKEEVEKLMRHAENI